jgi:hypothetical protein
LWIGFVAGCASSGDVEQVRQERAQAKAKMSAELQQESALTASMQKESEARKAEAEKLAKALGGKGKPQAPSGNLMAQASGGTTLQITNGTSAAVPVQITLGNSGNPASNYGISNINQLPSSWGTIYPDPSAPTTQGIFILAGNSSVSFNSGTLSFAGNVAFGPTFTGRGCGSSTSNPNPCYQDSITLGEFALNLGASGSETVDISGVNGTNAAITINFSGQGANNQWNDGTFSGANPNVTSVANQPMTSWTAPPGVYGWQATNCINVVPPVPNPIPNCPAPVDAPSSAQLQTNAQCNIQRAQGAPTGGTVQIVFTGYASPTSTPQPGCAGAYIISPNSGSQSGGTSVTMIGWGLSQVTGVTFQGAAATIVSQSDTQLVVTTPACNFCTMSQPWYSNVILTLSNTKTYTLPASVAGLTAPAAWTYTSN